MALARFFGIEPLPGETLAVDGKVLRGSYQLESDNPDSPPHWAITLGSVLKPAGTLDFSYERMRL